MLDSFDRLALIEKVAGLLADADNPEAPESGVAYSALAEKIINEIVGAKSYNDGV